MVGENKKYVEGWVKLARNEPDALITWFDEEFSLVELTRRQLTATYDLGDGTDVGLGDILT